MIFMAASLASLAACGQSSMPKHSESGEILAVHVTAAGIITANGREVSLDQLKQEFARLASVGGTVRYSRDDPHRDPHPNAMKVMEALVDAKLPIEMLEPVS